MAAAPALPRAPRRLKATGNGSGGLSLVRHKARKHRPRTPLIKARGGTVEVFLGRCQMKVYDSAAQFRVLVAGRRFGKTVLAVVELLTHAMAVEGSVNWYVGPTYKQAKMNMWKLLVRTIPPAYLAKPPNESALMITLINGSVIEIKGADKPDSLRGPGLDFVVLDEFATMRPEVWEEILVPATADKNGAVLFIGTPKGFNLLYDLFERGQNGERWPEWESWQFTTMDGGRVSAKVIARDKATMHPRTFAQEYLAKFTSLQNRVYDSFDRNVHRTPDCDDVEPDGQHALPDLLVGMDFNINPMSAVLAVRAGDQCHVFDEIELPVSNTEEMAAEIKDRYPDRNVIVCPDPSGNARKTSAHVGQTDFAILRAAGFDVRADAAAPPVKDRINNTQAMLEAADGTVRLYINPRCTRLIRCLEGLTYKKGSNAPDKTLKLDHLPDALDYLLWQEFNIVANREWKVSKFRI